MPIKNSQTQEGINAPATGQSLTLNRRQFLGTIPLVFLMSGKSQPSLENDSLVFSLKTDAGKISARNFENRLTGRSFSLPAEEFFLKFDDGKTVSSMNMDLRRRMNNKNLIELLFSEKSGLQVRVSYSLPAGARYLRKQISVHHSGKASGRILLAEQENWKGVSCGWTSMQRDPLPYGSYPVYCENLWAGVEFVVAFNEYDQDGFVLRSRPGGKSIGTGWLDLHPTVVGVSENGKVRDSFLRYIEDIRLAPPRMVACYNSWWTLPRVVKQSDNLSLIKELSAGMHEPHGIFFDIITTDMGWSNPQSIWEIDRSILPRGFDDIRSIVEPAGGRLGLWMSPSELYPPVCDYDWAEKNGYKVIRPDRDKKTGSKPGVSLADPRYRNETKEQLKELIRENNLGHIKYDGFIAIESEPHNDLLPGEDSVEPLASYSLELLQVSKETDPSMVTEPTYMNSFYNYISPWIIKYSDTVWGNAVDCVVGIIPAPDYRESHTTAREYMIFKSLDQIWLPQNAIQYFDITHVDEKEGFPNHAAMAFGRGRFFISTYLNPKLMNADDWRIYAGLLKWARLNTDILRNTKVLRSRVETGEPYVYAHWLGKRGILVVRNPSNESREYILELDKTGAPSDLADAVCYSQFPCRRGIAGELHSGSRITFEMSPWEVTFLEVLPRSELRETVTIGSRWYNKPDGTMSLVPDGNSENIRLIEPGGKEHIIPVTKHNKEEFRAEITGLIALPVPEDRWLPAKTRTIALFPFKYPLEMTPEQLGQLKETGWENINWKRVPTLEFEVSCDVKLPVKSTGKILLLLEFPGRIPYPASCEAWVDDQTVVTEEKSSAEHIGFFVPDGSLRPFESEWQWYICPVPGGSHLVRFRGLAGHENPKIGLWLWADTNLTEPVDLPSFRCNDPALPQYLDRMKRKGICLRESQNVKS